MQRDPPQRHGDDHANHQGKDIGGVEVLDKGDVGCCSGDGGYGIEVAALEDAGRLPQEYVAQHTASDGCKEAHHYADHGGKLVHHRFVRADGSVKAYGEDVENGDEAIGFLEDNRKDKGDGGGGDGHGQRERLVENVDGAFLQDDIADDTAAKSACDGETDSANEVEFVLAGGKHARH